MAGDAKIAITLAERNLKRIISDQNTDDHNTKKRRRIENDEEVVNEQQQAPPPTQQQSTAAADTTVGGAIMTKRQQRRLEMVEALKKEGRLQEPRLAIPPRKTMFRFQRFDPDPNDLEQGTEWLREAAIIMKDGAGDMIAYTHKEGDVNDRISELKMKASVNFDYACWILNCVEKLFFTQEEEENAPESEQPNKQDGEQSKSDA